MTNGQISNFIFHLLAYQKLERFLAKNQHILKGNYCTHFVNKCNAKKVPNHVFKVNFVLQKHWNLPTPIPRLTRILVPGKKPFYMKIALVGLY